MPNACNRNLFCLVGARAPNFSFKKRSKKWKSACWWCTISGCFLLLGPDPAHWICHLSMDFSLQSHLYSWLSTTRIAGDLRVRILPLWRFGHVVRNPPKRWDKRGGCWGFKECQSGSKPESLNLTPLLWSCKKIRVIFVVIGDDGGADRSTVLSSALRNKEKVDSKPYRIKAKDGSFVRIRTKMFSFKNPFTKEVEYLAATHAVLP